MNQPNTSVDVAIIGGGPGGYVAAIRAAQLGLDTVCVEMDKTLGGTCVNVGCIPSKALLTSSEHYEFARTRTAEHGFTVSGVELDLAQMMKRKDDVVGQNTKGIEFLFRKNKVAWAKGRGTLRAAGPDGRYPVEVEAADGAVTTYLAKHVILATGSAPVELPFLKFDEERVLSNVGALKIPVVPEHLCVIGAGVIGLELGSVWRRLGAKVTVVDVAPTVLPGNDADVVKEAEKIFRKQGLDFRLGVRVTGAERHDAGVRVTIEQDGAPETIEADYVLVSVGRRSSLTGIDAEALGLALGKRGEILADMQLRTNLPNVFAIGDAIGGKLLAHKAEDEGVIAAEVIAGQNVHMHYRSIPGVVYTQGDGAQVPGGQVPLLGQRPRAHDGRHERIREGDRRRRDRRASRRAHDRPERLGPHRRGGARIRVPRGGRGPRGDRARAPDAQRGHQGGGPRRARPRDPHLTMPRHTTRVRA
jgi:dihydrolipoamide dehydrogenase